MTHPPIGIWENSSQCSFSQGCHPACGSGSVVYRPPDRNKCESFLYVQEVNDIHFHKLISLYMIKGYLPRIYYSNVGSPWKQSLRQRQVNLFGTTILSSGFMICGWRAKMTEVGEMNFSSRLNFVIHWLWIWKTIFLLNFHIYKVNITKPWLTVLLRGLHEMV